MNATAGGGRLGALGVIAIISSVATVGVGAYVFPTVMEYLQGVGQLNAQRAAQQAEESSLQDVKAQIAEIENDPEYIQAKQDYDKAVEWCGMRGLGEIPVGLVELALFESSYSELPVDKTCPEKRGLVQIAGEVGGRVRDGIDFTCTHTDYGMLFEGTINVSSLPRFPEGVVASAIDVRIEGAYHIDGEKHDVKEHDVFDVEVGVPRTFSFSLDRPNSAAEECSLNVTSFWPTGY